MSVSEKKRLHAQAETLRKEGYSYSYIQETLNVPKSTLSDWLTNISYNPNKTAMSIIEKGYVNSARTRSQNKLDNIHENVSLATAEIGKMSKRDLWMFGIGLYFGEGSKTIESVRVTNSDPKVIKVAIRWLIEVIGLSKKNLSLSLHSYPDNNIEDDIHFWSGLSGIPSEQFGKTQIDVRKGKHLGHKLPHGTVQLRVLAKGESRFGVSLHRRIMAWIDAVAEYRGDLV